MFMEKFIIDTFKKNLNKMLGIDKMFAGVKVGETSIEKLCRISADGLREERDIPYKNSTGQELLMDIIRPDTSEKLPVVIYIHGGALIEGSKDVSLGYVRLLAKRGYIVCSIEYRLIPEVRVYEQFSDVCAGISYVAERLSGENADLDRVYLSGESAGAYLSVYVAAMQKSAEMREIAGCKVPDVKIKAMGLIGGMFYTVNNDEIGKYLSRSIYDKSEQSNKFEKFKNPECPEIIKNLPPCYFMTSKKDLIERYSIDFAGAMGSLGIEYKLHHMGSNPKLIHAFPMIHPEYHETELVLDAMTKWFDEHR